MSASARAGARRSTPAPGCQAAGDERGVELVAGAPELVGGRLEVGQRGGGVAVARRRQAVGGVVAPVLHEVVRIVGGQRHGDGRRPRRRPRAGSRSRSRSHGCDRAGAGARRARPARTATMATSTIAATAANQVGATARAQNSANTDSAPCATASSDRRRPVPTSPGPRGGPAGGRAGAPRAGAAGRSGRPRPSGRRAARGPGGPAASTAGRPVPGTGSNANAPAPTPNPTASRAARAAGEPEPTAALTTATPRSVRRRRWPARPGRRTPRERARRGRRACRPSPESTDRERHRHDHGHRADDVDDPDAGRAEARTGDDRGDAAQGGGGNGDERRPPDQPTQNLDERDAGGADGHGDDDVGLRTRRRRDPRGAPPRRPRGPIAKPVRAGPDG